MKANPALTNTSFLPVFGFTAFSAWHTAFTVLPSKAASFKTEIEQSREQINAALSIDTIFTPSAPAIAGLTMIDPTFLQAGGGEVSQVRQLSPTSITDTGVFVGSFADYVGLSTYLDKEKEGEVEFEILTL